jgi:flagellar P-ring protein precursor FlgI
MRIAAVLVTLAWTGVSGSAFAARLKDIAFIRGLQSSHLIGFGLVTGLNRTGDQTTGVPFTGRAVENLLRNMGITLDELRGQMRLGNVAAVMVTAEAPPFLRQGSRLDVLVSSLGDATSLQGGTLLDTGLWDAQGEVVAAAQGPITTGGFLVQVGAERAQKNHVTAGRIPNGAILMRDLGTAPIATPGASPDPAQPAPSTLTLGLQNPDFTTAAAVATALNQRWQNSSIALDAASVQVTIPPASAADLVQFISELEQLSVTPDHRARVIIDERTGTVVMGENVRISTVAVAHASLTVQVFERPLISQPEALSGGETVVVPDVEIAVTEESMLPLLNQGGSVQVLSSGVTLNELVQALNAIGISPRDLIAVLQAIKQAGALQAELVIM